MVKEHDLSYRNLFSNPQMIKDLLTGFIKPDWLDELDFDSLDTVPGHFVTDDLQERESDIIWKIRWKDKTSKKGKTKEHGEWIYIFILLEFQSGVDRFMALRMVNYLTLLYQDLIKRKQLPASKKLPPVLPIVLYNGNKRWHAKSNIADLIQNGPPGLKPFQPTMQYLVIDEGSYSNSTLKPLKNLVAALFRLENSRNATDIQNVVVNLVDWLAEPQQARLKSAFLVWIKRVIIEPVSLSSVPLLRAENSSIAA